MKPTTPEVSRTREFPFGGQREIIPLIVGFNDWHCNFIAKAFETKAHYIWDWERTSVSGRLYSKLIVFDPTRNLSDERIEKMLRWIDMVVATRLVEGGEYYLV